MAVALDSNACSSRLNSFYKRWRSSEESDSFDAFLIINGKCEDAYCKTISFQIWLFGYELQDTAVLLTRNGIHILSSRKKIEFVKQLKNTTINGGVSVTLLTRNPEDNDAKNIEKLVEAFSSSDNETRKLGLFLKEQFDSEFSKKCGEALKSKASDCLDSASFFSEVFAVKDNAEIELMKKSSDITCSVFSKHLKEKIMDVIDDDRRVPHVTLSSGCHEALKNKELIKGFEADYLELCYEPIIQSGSNYSLKFSAESDKKPLHFGTIVCSLGVRYHSYCSNVIRTLIVNPTEEQCAYYEYMHNLLDWIIQQIKPGLKLSVLYQNAVNKVQAEHPELVDKMTKTFGFVTGIEFRDSCHVIGPKSNAVFLAGMPINLNIGFQDLVNKEAESDKYKSYSLWIGDVVLVGESENLVLTLSAKRRPKSIFLHIEEGDAEDENVSPADTRGSEKSPRKSGKTAKSTASSDGASGRSKTANSVKQNKLRVANGTAEELLGRGHRKAIIDQKTRSEQTSEEKRLEKRRELFEKLQTNSRNRLTGLTNGNELEQKTKSNVAYKGSGQMPKEDDVRKLRIFVDKKYETVILPIFGQPTPFHISTLKNVSSSIEADYTYLRINFHHPGAVLSAKDASNFQTPQSTFLKELTYRASNQRHHNEATSPSTNLNNAYRIIKEVLKRFRSREAEERERANLVEQDVLMVTQGKSCRLRDLYIRPNIVSKRITGTLEAHTNGFRFTSIRGDKVDILYNNIKHAFYQPCDGEMIILLHFHLKNAIMYGKKKQTDIQFYAEVGELTTDLGKNHSRMYDRDDIEVEEREREMREQIKHAFKAFVEKVEELAKRYNLDFETPFRDLGFFGCPIRSTVLMIPTSNCLVSLVEWPPFVITLEDVEFVMLERVSLSIKTFDMVFILKDYRAKPVMINSIPSSSLDLVKEWVMSCDIFYYEGAKSLNWPKLMKTIVDNPQDFLEQNGWSFISPDDDAEDEEEEESDEDDESYVPSGASGGSEDGNEDSEEEEDDEEDEDWGAEEESESEASLDSDESEGKNWDELEEEALREDRKFARAEESEGSKPNKRHRSPSPATNTKKSKHFVGDKHKKYR